MAVKIIIAKKFSSKLRIAFGTQSFGAYFEQIPVDRWVP